MSIIFLHIQEQSCIIYIITNKGGYMPKITPNLTKEAKAIYDLLPATINKSQWISELILKSKEAKAIKRVKELENK